MFGGAYLAREEVLQELALFGAPDDLMQSIAAKQALTPRVPGLAGDRDAIGLQGGTAAA